MAIDIQCDQKLKLLTKLCRFKVRITIRGLEDTRIHKHYLQEGDIQFQSTKELEQHSSILEDPSDFSNSAI